jgi:hypothetical protein
MRYIKVSDIQRKIRELSTDIRCCKNLKVKKRLEEEQAAYILTLRNATQHELKVGRTMTRIVE